jgi:hypothetical protein
MIYLYVKTHNQTGLKYLGQTTAKDPHKYPGSGKYWKLHLKKHGPDFSTEILKECSTKHEVQHWGEYYSLLWNVVNDPAWANLKPETGEGGWPKRLNFSHTEETKKKIGITKKGVPNPKNSIPRTEEQKEHLRKLNARKTRPVEVVEKIKETKSKNPFKHTEEFKERMRAPKSEKTKARMRESWHKKRKETERIWITDGVKNLLVEKNLTIPNGWIAGRMTNTIPPSQKGKFWINDGILNKMSFDIPVGWKRGKLSNRKENRNGLD